MVIGYLMMCIGRCFVRVYHEERTMKSKEGQFHLS